MVDDTIVVELIKRVEELERKLSSPKFSEPTNNCALMMTTLGLGVKETMEATDLLIDRWFWAITNSIAADEIIRNEVIECRKKLGLKIPTHEDYQKEMKKALKHAKKLIAEGLKEGSI